MRDAAKHSMPALDYVGTYAFAKLILTLAGTIRMSLSELNPVAFPL